MMEPVIGGTKLTEAVDNIHEMIELLHERHPDLRIEDVGIVVEVSHDREGRGGPSQGRFMYAHSDVRAWVQEAFFQRVIDVVNETDYDDVWGLDEEDD